MSRSSRAKLSGRSYILNDRISSTLNADVFSSTGSIASRAAKLDRFLQTSARGRGVNMLGHSMGGLDARHLITHIRPREYAPLSLTSYVLINVLAMLLMTCTCLAVSAHLIEAAHLWIGVKIISVLGESRTRRCPRSFHPRLQDGMKSKIYRRGRQNTITRHQQTHTRQVHRPRGSPFLLRPRPRRLLLPTHNCVRLPNNPLSRPNQH